MKIFEHDDDELLDVVTAAGIHGANDRGVVYRSRSTGKFGWRRQDMDSGEIVARSAGGEAGLYEDHDYALAACAVYCAGCPIEDMTVPDDPIDEDGDSIERDGEQGSE